MHRADSRLVGQRSPERDALAWFRLGRFSVLRQTGDHPQQFHWNKQRAVPVGILRLEGPRVQWLRKRGQRRTWSLLSASHARQSWEILRAGSLLPPCEFDYSRIAHPQP